MRNRKSKMCVKLDVCMGFVYWVNGTVDIGTEHFGRGRASFSVNAGRIFVEIVLAYSSSRSSFFILWRILKVQLY